MPFPPLLFGKRLDEQEAGEANFTPGWAGEKSFKFHRGSRKCGARFPEQGVVVRWIVRGGSHDEIVEPPGLWRSQEDRLVASVCWENEPRSFSDWFTDRLAAEPHEPPFCLGMIYQLPVFEETPGPGGRDARFWHGMVEPFADIEREPSSFEKIEHRPAEAFADPLRCVAAAIPVLEFVFCKSSKRRAKDA